MKVLMFGWEFPPFISGGLGMACYGITRGLINNDVDIRLVLPTKRGVYSENQIEIVAADEVVLSEHYRSLMESSFSFKTGKQMLQNNISPYYTQSSAVDFFNKYQHLMDQASGTHSSSVMGFSGNYGKDLMNEVFRYSIIGEYLGSLKDFDIVHAHDWVSILAGVAAKKISGRPLILHIHATEYDRSGENMNQNVFNIEKFGMEQADKIVAVSYYTKNTIITHYGIEPHKIVVVHNAVEKQKQIERFGIQKNLKDKYVLFLGRVTMQKGPDYFIEAANLVLKKLKNVRFIMAGSGDMMPKLISRAATLKITDKFHFTGFLNRVEVEKMYAMSDLYVMPSVSEPFGITAFEALLYDVPIILSKQSGVSEVLKDAIQVDFWDVEKLASVIVNLLQDEKLSKEIVERCKHELKNIHWNNAGYKLKNLYHAISFSYK
jgi:glycogen(starch) synthase